MRCAMNSIVPPSSRLLGAVGIGLMALSTWAAAPAMELELSDIDGHRFVHLADYAGGAVVVNFWSSDCPPCRAEMPVLALVAQAHQQVQFLGVAVDDRSKARAFLARGVGQSEFHYPQLLAPQDSDGIMRRFGDPQGALPYTVVLYKSHAVCKTHRGAVDALWLAGALRACTA